MLSNRHVTTGIFGALPGGFKKLSGGLTTERQPGAKRKGTQADREKIDRLGEGSFSLLGRDCEKSMGRRKKRGEQKEKWLWWGRGRRILIHQELGRAGKNGGRRVR